MLMFSPRLFHCFFIKSWHFFYINLIFQINNIIIDTFQSGIFVIVAVFLFYAYL